MNGYATPPSGGLDANLLWAVVLAAIVSGIGILMLVRFLKSFLYIAKPSEALVFSGRNYTTEDGSVVGYQVVKSGQRRIRWPIIERVDALDMSLIPIDIVVQQAYSRGNIPLRIHAVANVKIHSSPRFLRNAVERFLNRSTRDIQLVARQTLEGALREVLAQLTPEEVNEDRLKFAAILMQTAEDDLQILGLQLDTLKIQNVSDETGYLDSIGRPVIANALRDAENAENQMAQEITQAQAQATQRAEVARAGAQTEIQKKQNGLRGVMAQLEGQAQSVELEAAAAAKTARAQAERELQGLRAQLEQRRLMAEVVIPAEFQQRAQTILAKGAAAPTLENGAAAVEVLRAMSEAFAAMGPDAREIYVIQHLEEIIESAVRSLDNVSFGEVHILDNGDGQAVAQFAAIYPKMVAEVLRSVRETTGINVPELLSAPSATARDSRKEGAK